MHRFYRSPIVKNYLICHVYALKEMIYYKQCVSATMPLSFGKKLAPLLKHTWVLE